MGHGSSRRSHTKLLCCNSQLLFGFIFLFFFLAKAAAKDYVWKTGRWHECQHYQCGEGGSQIRSVFCGERFNFNEVDASNCNGMRKPEASRSCFKVCSHHQKLLRWAPYEWTDCSLSPEYRECSIKHGVRYRNVTCVWKDTGFIEEDSVCAEFEPKAETEERCKLKCPQDCVVSKFSTWNVCDTCLLVNTTRTRALIVPPNNGGRTCPSFTEMKPCDNCTETYTYKLGPWEKCTAFEHYIKMRDNVHPALGYQKRIIQCINSKGNPVSYQYCMDYLQSSGGAPLLDRQMCVLPRDCQVDKYSEMMPHNTSCYRPDGSRVPGFMIHIRVYDPTLYCMDYLQSSGGAPLLDRQTCVLPRDCQVDKYSEMMPHNTSCYRPDGSRVPGFMIRTRRIMQVPQGTGKPCPPLVHFFPVQSSDEKPCPLYSWKMSTWSECRTPSGGYPCTTGLQTRAAICIEQDDTGREKPTANELCTDRRPLTARTCQAECDIDCVVSPWTEWSDCKVTDCDLYLRRRRNNEGTGQRHRTRKPLMSGRGAGKRCPHFSETQMCDPQPCYHWNITVGECRLLHSNTSPECGLGIAYRTLTCMNKLGHRVTDIKCEELQERPAEKEDCNIACPNDCILSPWSAWSPCPTLCQDGRSMAAKQTRERTILAMPGQGGASCPPNRELLQVQICPTTIECAIYVWQFEPWDTCRINDPKKNCGPGRQTRDVKCYSLEGQLVSDQRCTLDVKPKDSQSCSVPCPVDCAVTDYSDWSECSSTCWEAKQTVPVMTRVRYVVQQPMFGGAACPIKLQEVRQCTNLTLCQKFYWDTTIWSRCVLPLHKIPQCGQGLQARDISCKAENGTAQPLDMCIRQIGPMPTTSRTCQKTCDEECRFEDWAEWSSCVTGCNGKRFRTRKLIEDPAAEDNRKTSKCRDQRLFPVDTFEKCLCDDHKPVPIGNWSECILESDEEFYKLPRPFQGYTMEGERTHEEIPPTSFRPSASLGVNAVCGQGRRYKVLACQNERGEVEAANQCTLKPYEMEKCLIACPVDCIMSEWSLWTDCSTSCGTGSQVRYRHIKQIPSDGGRQCPTLDHSGKEIQTRVCSITCRRYMWQTLKWSPCMPYRTYTSCGNGTQSRNVRCVIMTEDTVDPEDVEDMMCRHLHQPPDTQACMAPCVGECVVSDWSDWTRCQQPCSNPNQVQTRTRAILRHPSPDPSHTCPGTLEERFCIRGDNCVEYRWEMSEWTSCLINEGEDDCGQGHKHRFPLCYNQLNMEENPQACKQALGESKDATVAACEVACDVDCLLTEWSPWSNCNNSCGLGNQQRTRDIVQEPKGNGRSCPGTYLQEKPCFERGCYTWTVSPWTPCLGHNGVCGDGIQMRNISCLADGGLAVNESNCAADLDIVIMEKQRACSVPCPGECVMAEWSEWNDCFLHCKDYSRAGFTRGVQSRSRAVLAYAQPGHTQCPEQLWESRPCEVNTCFTFVWNTSPWSPQKTRTVWCERSDGLLIDGGCPEHSKPSTTLSCNPPCSVPDSVCNNTNVCVCEPNFRPSYNRLSVLIECIRMDNSTETNPSPKTVTLPTDGPTNVWMYAVIAAGTLFVIFLAVACYTMSEFFHKGPRPRKKDEEKSLEGADSVEGMVAETELASCNHVPPVVAISELDSQSVISADRTPPQSVRAARSTHACNGNAGMSVAPFVPGHPSRPSPNPVSGRASRDAPDSSSGQQFGVLLHDTSDSRPDSAGHVWRPHATRQHGNSSSLLHDYVELEQLQADTAAMHERSVYSNKARNNTQNTNYDSDPAPLYAEVDRKGKFKSSVANQKGYDRNKNVVGVNNGGRYSKSKLPHDEGSHQVGAKLGRIDYQDTVVPETHRDLGDSVAAARSDRDQRDGAARPENVVYLNREASDSDDDQTSDNDDKRNSISLNTFLQTVLEKIDNITSGDEGVQDNDLNGASAPDNDDIEMESVSVSELEAEPLLGRPNIVSSDSRKPQSAFSTKSSSMDVPLSQCDSQNQSMQMYDSDDDTASRTQSLRSHVSGRSRTSHLSYTLGPVIKIDPDEATVYDYNRNSLPQTGYSNRYPGQSLPGQSATLPNHSQPSHSATFPNQTSPGHSATFPNQQMNIGYISLSSIETELSTAPSSSVSCDSLSPRSLPSSECSAVDSLHVRGMDTSSDKTSRNVALGSLKNAKSMKKQLKNLDPELFKDSGTGSLSLNIDSPGDKTASPRKSPMYGSGRINDMPTLIEPTAANHGKFRDDATNRDQYFVKSHHQNGFHDKGDQGKVSAKHSQSEYVPLLAPVHFVKLGPNGSAQPVNIEDLDSSEV